MLFYAKQRVWLSILVMLGLFALSNLWAWLRGVDFGPAMDFSNDKLLIFLLAVMLGVTWIFSMDSVIYLCNWIVGFKPFLTRFDQAIEQLFARVHPAAIITGGLLAATESLFFHGVVQTELGLIPMALIFMLLHIGRGFAMFGVWGLLEALAFGWLYHITGNLLVPMIVHGLHDAWGIAIGRYLYKGFFPPADTLFDWLLKLNQVAKPKTVPLLPPPSNWRPAVKQPMTTARKPIEAVAEHVQS